MDFGLLILAYRPCFEPQPFYNVISIGLRSWSCQLPSCNSFTSHSCFIVFWERDITSEHHETPVHITIIDHIHYLLFAIYLLLQKLSITTIIAFNPLWTTRPEGLTTSLYSLGAKLFVSVCRSTLIANCAVSNWHLNLGVSGDSILGIFAKGKHFYNTASYTFHLG